MQFNPACLSGPPINSTNVSCNTSGQQPEFINNIQSYTDTSSTNGWNNQIINSLPLYGIFNSRCVFIIIVFYTYCSAYELASNIFFLYIY